MSDRKSLPGKNLPAYSIARPFAALFASAWLLIALGCGGGSSGGDGSVTGGGGNPPPPTFVTVDAPGAGDTRDLGTKIQSINAGGDVTGIFTDSNNTAHGFLRTANGTLTAFDVPGAGTQNSQGSYAQGINASGDIAGYIIDQNLQAHGFLRAGSGSYSTFDVPGAYSTLARGLNDGGVITGEYLDTNNIPHGYVRASDGTITTFDPVSSSSTLPMNVNASGTVVGTYTDSNSMNHGFTRDASGFIALADAHGSVPGEVIQSQAMDINGSEAVVGVAFKKSSPQGWYCFLLAGGSSPLFNPPGAPFPGGSPGVRSSGDATASGINDTGAIVGNFTDAAGALHGYLRNPDGTIVILDDPQASSSAAPPGTVVTGINAKGAIVGYYFDQFNAIHGFIRR
jgi:hypothetical protein